MLLLLIVTTMPTTKFSNLPSSTHNNTYIARLLTDANVARQADSRGTSKISVGVIDPETGAEIITDIYVPPGDMERVVLEDPWFLIQKQGAFKPDGDKYRAFSYTTENPKASSNYKLLTYITPGIHKYLQTQANGFGRGAYKYFQLADDESRALESDPLFTTKADTPVSAASRTRPTASASSKAGTPASVSSVAPKAGRSSSATSSVPKGTTAKEDVFDETIDAIDPSVYSVGSAPYIWSAIPMPHWAYVHFNKLADAGRDLPEIFQPNSYMRIGSVAFIQCAGVTDLHISESAQVSSTPVLRQASSLKRISGNIKKTVDFTLMFGDPKSIADELIPFLKQSRRAPFMPVIHQELYDAGIDALAIESINITTVPGTPELLQVQIRAQQFNWRRYLLDAEEFDLCMNYPLMDIWLAYPGDEEEDIPYYAKPPNYAELLEPWTSSFDCFTPSRAWLALVNDNESASDTQGIHELFIRGGGTSKPTNLLYDAIGAIGSGNTASIPTLDSSPNMIEDTGALQVKDDQGNHYLAIRLASPALMEAGFAPTARDGADIIVSQLVRTHSDDPNIVDVQSYLINDQKSINAGESQRSVKYTSLLKGEATFDHSYWGLWRKDRLGHMPRMGGPDKRQSYLSSPLGVAAQLTFLDPTRPAYIATHAFEDLTILNVTAGMRNTLAEFSPEDEDTPTHQHIGSSDIVLTIEAQCPELTARALEDFMRSVSRLAVDFRGQWDGSAYGGYCYISNEIARLVGITTAVPVSLAVDTVPMFPSERRISMTFISFDIAQRRISTPSDFGNTDMSKYDKRHAPGTSDSSFQLDYNRQDLHADQYAVLDKHLQGVCLYPDIRPPTWTRLKKWVEDISEGKVWDYANGRPFPDYSFLPFWNYDKSYWPIKNKGGFLDHVVQDGFHENHVFHSIKGSTTAESKLGFEPPTLEILDAGGKPIPGAIRVGYADPDFYCCPRGDHRKNVGKDKVEAACRVLYGSTTDGSSANKEIQTTAHQSVYWGSDGTKMSTTFGSKDMNFADDVTTARSANAHRMETYNDPENLTSVSAGGPGRSVLPVPRQAAKDNSRGQLEGTFASQPYKTSDTQYATAAEATAAGDGYDPSNEFGYLYIDLIRKASKDHGVEVALIQAVINKESTGRPRLVNSLGFSGLMQIKPGASEGVPLNATREQLLDPAHNIDWGTFELAGCLKRHPGDLALGLADYNAGQGTVRKYHGVPPYKETHDYIRIVSANYNRIRLRKSPETIHKESDQKASLSGRIDALQTAYEKRTAPQDAQIKAAQDANDAISGNPLLNIGQKLTLQLPNAWKAVKAFGSKIPEAVSTESEVFKLNGDENADPNANAAYPYVNVVPWDADRAAYDPIAGEDIFWSYRRSEMSGRLLQAFPTFCIMIASGGPVFRVWRLSDVFYGLHSPVEINTFASRKVAGDSCEITFADPYNNLSAVSADILIAKQNDTRSIVDIRDVIEGIINEFYPTDDLARRREEELKSVLLKPGNRLHVRLGFGSDAANLPIVFNGTITTVNRKSDMVQVTGLGDGVELTNPLNPGTSDQGAYVRSGDGGSGENIRNIICSYFTDTESDQMRKDMGIAGIPAQIADKATAGYFFGGNPYGITHFGTLNRGLLGLTDMGEVGPNIYSGFSETPVNVTYASDDLPIVANLIPQLYHAATEDIESTIRSGADKLFGVYTGDGFTANMDECSLFRRMGGEPVVGLDMEKASPWDVISTLRYVAKDYIRTVDTFGLRSSLFFGKSYWPYHYQYDYAAIGAYRKKRITSPFIPGVAANSGFLPDAGSKLTGGDGDPLYDLEVVFRRRPYMQVHVAHSGHNLIGSEIEATDEDWSSIVQSMGTCCGIGGIETSFAQFLDVNIYPEMQRLKLVKSGLYSSSQMRWADAGYSLATSMPWLSTNVLNNHAVGVLHDEVRDMYRGNIVVSGNPYVKPFHLLHLDDDMKKMTGLVEVKEVAHSFTAGGGFVTIMSPDCLAATADPSMSLIWGHAITVVGRVMAGNILMKLVTTRSGRYLMRKAAAKMMASVDVVDRALDRGIGRQLKFTESYLSKVFRTRWVKSIPGTLVVAGFKGIDDSYFGGKNLHDRRSIQDEFTRQAKKRTLRVDKNKFSTKKDPGFVNKLQSIDYNHLENRILGRKMNKSAYDDIYKATVENEYKYSLSTLTEEERKDPEFLKTLRERVEKRVTQHTHQFDPGDNVTKAGDPIEEETLLHRFQIGVDPDHGEGSKWNPFTLLRRKRAIKATKENPSRATEVTKEAYEALAREEKDITALIEELETGNKDRNIEEYNKILRSVQNIARKSKSPKLIAKAKAAEKKVSKVLDKAQGEANDVIQKEVVEKLNLKIADAQKNLDEASKISAKLPGREKKAAQAERFRLQATLNNYKRLKQRVLNANTGSSVSKEEALAKLISSNEKLSSLITGTFASYGHWVPEGHEEGVLLAGEKLAEKSKKAVELAHKGVDKAKNLGKAISALARDDKGLSLLMGGKRIAKAVFSLCTGGCLTVLDRYLISRHALFCQPLQSCGREFSAGINGHRGLVVGDHLGQLDNMLSYIFDDTKSPLIAQVATGLVGLGGIHFTPDPAQYQEITDGLGIRTNETPEDTEARYTDHLRNLKALNALGYNLEDPTQSANGPTSTVPGGPGSVPGASGGVPGTNWHGPIVGAKGFAAALLAVNPYSIVPKSDHTCAEFVSMALIRAGYKMKVVVGAEALRDKIVGDGGLSHPAPALPGDVVYFSGGKYFHNSRTGHMGYAVGDGTYWGSSAHVTKRGTIDGSVRWGGSGAQVEIITPRVHQ